MRKSVIFAVLMVLTMSFGLVINQDKAAAVQLQCTGTTRIGIETIPYCLGYFTSHTTTTFNSAIDVLPSSTGLYAYNAFELTNYVDYYLHGYSFESGTPVLCKNVLQCQAGGAFIIDTMLGHGTFSSSIANGVNFILANNGAEFTAWYNLVYSYANSTVPGYSVTWNTAPVCNTNALNSGWFTDPSMQDDAFHNSICNTKNPNQNDTTPELVFNWPGGSFHIGQNCGNLEGNIGALPPVPQTDHPPIGRISIMCSANQQIANVSFSDQDGTAKNAYATPSSSGGNPQKPVTGSPNNNITSIVIPPNINETIYLFVQDILPGGSTGKYVNVANAQTQPCPTFKCGNLNVVSATGAPSIDSSMKFNVTVYANIATGTPPPSASMNIKIFGSSGTTYTYNNQSLPASGNPLKASANNLGPTNVPGTYTVIWNINPPYPAINPPCKGTFTVANLPYLQVYGGDVMIGASPTYNPGNLNCARNPSAGIYGWNNLNDFSGSGSQYAVQALGQIDGFASAQNSSSSPPTDLSFANTSTNPSVGMFGGSFIGTTADCDFTSDLTGVTQQTGSNVILPVNVSNQQPPIYAKGDVYIGKNIVYCPFPETTCASPTWLNPSSIPYFKLIVVGGNIYIDHSVTELDGLYVAEPDSSGVGGTIYTCATGSLPSPSASPLDITNNYTTSQQKLNIYGSFVAQQVDFLRTNGTLSQAKPTDSNTSNSAAEVFDYTPEMWLPRNSGITDNGYTAITSLPPVL